MENTEKGAPPKTFLQLFPLHIIAPMFVQIALIVGMLVVGAVYLGKFLDTQFNSRPWLTLALFLIATLIALPIIYRLGTRTITKLNELDPLPKKAEPPVPV